MEAGDSTDVPYDGPSLVPDTAYRWTLDVWNDQGEQATTSEEPFSTAPDLSGAREWISYQPGAGDSNGYRSEWLRPGERAWVQIDLGEPRAISRVELHPAEPWDGPTTPDGIKITARDTEADYFASTVAQGPLAFGFPREYRIDVAGDPSFSNGTTVVDTREGPNPRHGTVSFDVEGEGRYVRLTATELPTYGAYDGLHGSADSWAVLALAGLSIRDESGADLATAKQVTASSSVENATWGRSHLVNGAYSSQMASESALFRRTFSLSNSIDRARIHLAGVGYSELFVNGERIGDRHLDPAWTDYSERVLFVTHNVTDQLREGENAIGVWLGRGWFGKAAREWTAFGSPRALVVLRIEFADGTTREIRSDEEWTASAGPIHENDIYDGETYDARREQASWATPAFADDHWDAAEEVDGPGGTLFPQQSPPIRVTDELAPERIRRYGDAFIVDFGQNHTGVVELAIHDPDRGTELTIEHAETLSAHGDLLTVDLRTATATDRYVAAGRSRETYCPRFTYHGYRYVKISGYPGRLRADDIRSLVLHSDVPATGSFACSNADLNRVKKNAVWGLRSNVPGVISDCAQRDERLGFSGDGHLAANALHYHFDAVPFCAKFLRDHADSQTEAGFLPVTMPTASDPRRTDVTWTYSYLALALLESRFGASDRSIREHYPKLQRYVEYWTDCTEGGLLPDEYAVYGDWVALERTDGPFGEPLHLFSNAYYYRTVRTMADLAASIGNEKDERRYDQLARETASAFNDRYLDSAAGTYRPVTQAVNAMPLALGLVPEQHEHAVVDRLVESVEAANRTLRTGFLGTPALLQALTEAGHAELAFDVVTNEQGPSWVYQVKNGATTVWERWDSDERTDDGMNSRNHSPFTLVLEWLYERLAGIRPEVGDHVTIAPAFVDQLDWVSATTEVRAGRIRSSWERTNGGLTVRVEIPWNMTGSVRLPVTEHQTVESGGEVVFEHGSISPDQPFDGIELDPAGELSIPIPAGAYTFVLE